MSESKNTARRANAGMVAVEVAVNIVLPLAVYSLLKARLGDVNALLASSGPPLAWSIFEFLRRRKIDAVSMLVLAGIVLSLLAFVGGGGVKMLQLRETLVAGLVGLVFLGSAAIRRPLIYYTARATISRTSPEKAARFAAQRDNGPFRRAMTTMTLVWGFGLVIYCAIAAALTFLLSIQAFLVVNPILGYGALGAITVWTIWFARRRIGPALQASDD